MFLQRRHGRAVLAPAWPGAACELEKWGFLGLSCNSRAQRAPRQPHGRQGKAGTALKRGAGGVLGRTRKSGGHVQLKPTSGVVRVFAQRLAPTARSNLALSKVPALRGDPRASRAGDSQGLGTRPLPGHPCLLGSTRVWGFFYQKPVSPVICASRGRSAPLGRLPPLNKENIKKQ